MKHRIVTAAQMKEIERAGDAHGLPYLQMMENAGLAAYAELQKQFPHPGRLLVVCGKGNNGGDGFVIARAAAKDGWSVTVLLAEGEPKTADATRNFERLHSLPVHICTDCSVLETQHFAAVVDALYGTGFHGELRPSGLAACGLIRRLHKSGAFVLAVDLPSGINTDTGEVAEGAAHADLTVTFDSYKPLHIAEIFCAAVRKNRLCRHWHPGRMAPGVLTRACRCGKAPARKRPRQLSRHAGVLFVILLQNVCTFLAERRKCGNRLI